MSSPLRMAVLGTGHLGRHHARNLGQMDGVQLIAVVDPSEERGRPAADTAKTAWIARPEDLPADLDAVSIAAPTPTHFALAKHFLERGVHVLVEKPMTASLEEARALAAIAAKSKRCLQVGHIERFNPVWQHVTSTPCSPRFIDAERFAAHTGRSLDTSVVFDLMIHDLDLVCALAASAVVDLRATGGVVVGPFEDWAECRLTFENGTVAEVRASRVQPAGGRRTRVFATDKTLEIDFQTRKLQIVEKGTATPQTVRELQGSDEEPLRRELASFVAAIRSGTRPLVSEVEGLRAVELADRVIGQIRRGRSL